MRMDGGVHLQNRSVVRGGPAALTFVLAAILVLGLLKQLRPDIALDDAPITYRYAVNLAEGRGFTYNVGERVLGTSTPLYTLILAGFYLVGQRPEVVSPVLGVLALAASIVLAFAIAQRLVIGSGYLVALLVASSGFLVVHSTSGMETSVYCSTILLALWAYMSGWTQVAFGVAAVCFLFRLDGLVVALALTAAEMLSARRFPWRGWLLFLALVAPWLVFATAYFGSPIPFSWLAKRTHAIPEPYWMVKFLVQDRTILYVVLAAIALPVTISPDTQWRWSRNIVLPIWLAGYTLAYSVAGIERYDWYLSPVYFGLYVLGGAGLWRVLRWLWDSHRIWALPGSVMALVVIAGMTRNASLGEVKATRQYLETVEAARINVGVWLKSHTPETAAIGTHFIGHIGYVSERYIYDFAGLVTPAVVAARSGESSSAPSVDLDYLVITERSQRADAENIVYQSEPKYFLVVRAK